MLVIDKNIIALPAPGHSRPVAFVFPLRSGHDGLHARSQTSIEVVIVKSWRNLFINDALAQCIGQNAFEAITHFDEHFVVVDKNEQYDAIVFVFLPNLPCSKYPHSVIVNRRIRLHRRENRDDNLVRRLSLEILQSVV